MHRKEIETELILILFLMYQTIIAYTFQPYNQGFYLEKILSLSLSEKPYIYVFIFILIIDRKIYD